MRFPLDRIYYFDKWYPLNTKTAILGWGFGEPYDSWMLERYPGLPPTHQGIDWTVNNEPTYTPENGTIIRAEKLSSGSNSVFILGESGVTHIMHHLASFSVAKGQRVAEGQQLGITDNTGWSSGAHLHYETQRNGIPFDPLTLFKKTMTWEEITQLYLLVFGRLPDEAAKGYLGHDFLFVANELMKSKEYQADAHVLQAVKDKFKVK